MGILSALDHYSKFQGTETNSLEIEYRLFSWGEIFPPFIGDREHSTAARFILTEFPFKLFSSSNPYDPLPQKLCLTFLPPTEDKSDHLSGVFPHEIASEFVAFLSLVTRRRIFLGKLTRYDRLPIEEEGEIYTSSHFQARQRLKEINPEEIYKLLQNLSLLDQDIAYGFVLAMRLYHAAVQMLFTEPEFSYLLLVTSLEAISSVALQKYKPDDMDAYLASRFPGLNDIQRDLPGETMNC